MNNRQTKRPKRSVARRASSEQGRRLALPMQRPVPAAFEPIEELGRSLVQDRTTPLLPSPSGGAYAATRTATWGIHPLPDAPAPATLLDDGDPRALARANASGLATVDLPPGLTPTQATGLRLLERAAQSIGLLKTVGGATLAAIGDAMADYGVDERDAWIYLQLVYLEHHGHKAAYFRAMFPGHMGGTGIREDVLCTAFPLPWDEACRGYRFDVFGRALKPTDDRSAYPLAVRWALTIAQDPAQPAWNPESGGTVLVNGQFDVAAYCARAYHPSSPIFARVEWRPGWKHAERCPVDPTDDGRAHDRTAAVRGLKLLERLRGVPAITMQGKKPGDGALWTGLPDFLDDLWSTIERHRKATGRRFPLITGKRGNTFRKMMRGGPGERTLGEWLGRAGLRPQEIEAGKITRENYARLFAE